MCLKFPLTNEEFLDVKGVGTHKLEKYGLAFIQAIRTYYDKNPDRERVLSATVESKKPTRAKVPDGKASHLITYDLYWAGSSISEIAKEREISLTTVESHIIKCAEEGLYVDWEKEIPIPFRSLIEAAINEVGSERLKPIKEKLPAEISYFMIRAYFFLKNH
jgi:ATP-dependent DNA helicase RecQ